MKNYFSLLLLSVLRFTSIMAQSSDIDSLNNLLSQERTDTGRINIINLISREYINSGDNKSALQFAKSAQEQSINTDYKKGIAVSYNNMGIVYTIQTDYVKALENYFMALKFGEESGNKTILAKTYNNMGIVYGRQNNYEKAVSSYLSSLKLSEEIKDWRMVAILYQNIGNIYSNGREYKTALEYFNKALTVCKGLDDIRGEGSVYNSMTTAYIELNEYDKALDIAQKALDINKKLGDKYQTASTLSGISDIYLKLKKYNDALHNMNEALILAKEISDENRRANCHNGLGEIYMELDDFNRSYKHLDTALGIGKRINDKSIIKESYKILSDLYMKKNDCKKSFDYHLLYIDYRDSINSTEGALEIERMQSKYESEKKERIMELEQMAKDEKQKARLDKERMMRYGFMVGFAFMIALSFFIYKSYRQKIKSNRIISEQKKLVEEQHKEISDSIRYASRLQKAILPPDDFMKSVLPEHFVLWKSREAVGGDFYFCATHKTKTIVALADATGHGTNGCLISMLSSNILSEIVKSGETIPSKILDKLNQKFNEALHKTDDSLRDGLDISIIVFDSISENATWAGANNPIWIIRNSQITEMKADKLAIGQTYNKDATYTNHEIELRISDSIYLFSDGICDQFNGDGKKFMKKRLRELLLSIQNKSAIEQKEIINSAIESWKSGVEQTDDISIIGIKI